MDAVATTFLYLAIALIVLLFFGPIIVLISIIGKVQIGPLHIDLSQHNKWLRILIGVLGLGIWFSIYFPLVTLALKFSSSQYISGLPPTQLINTETPPLIISTPAVQQWPRGNLIVDENFNDKKADNWVAKFGNVEIVEILENGQPNYVLQLEAGLAYSVLPENISDYVVETRIMQVSGNEGLGIIQIRMMSENPERCSQEYKTYIDVTQDWLTLVEDDPIKCDENRETGLFGARKVDLSPTTWYLLRIEAKGPNIRVYLDNVLQISDEDDKLKSNIIALATCCSAHRFYFDDVKVWEIP